MNTQKLPRATRPWHYAETRGFPHELGRPHSVMGPLHPDGDEVAPLASFRDKEDAILAAAAPELLEVMREALTVIVLSPHKFRSLSTIQQVEQRMDDAIAKALGKTS